MIKIRNSVFETNSSSTHSITVKKVNDDGKINAGDIISLKEYMREEYAVTQVQRLQFVFNALNDLVDDYRWYVLGERHDISKEDWFKSEPYELLRKVVKEESDAELIFVDKDARLGGDDKSEKSSYEVLFGDFNVWADDAKEKYPEYLKGLKNKIKEYIFGNYVLESIVREW